MAEEVKVLNLWASPFGMRVLIALQEKDVTYTYIEENIYNKSELLGRSNPVRNKVPVFFHSDKTICESNIIVQYIDETWSGKSSLMPCDPFQRAQVRFWADFIDKKLYENAGGLILAGKEEEGKQNLLEYLGLLENQLGNNEYFGGEEFGFLDICLIPFCAWFDAFETLGNWKIPFESDFPKLSFWMEKCLERESVKKVMYDPEKIVEFSIPLRKRIISKHIVLRV